MNKSLLIFLFAGLSFYSAAQLQDSHFFKVDESEISSDFELNSFWKTYVEGSFFKNEKDRFEKVMKVKLYAKLDLEISSQVRAEFEPYLTITQGAIQNSPFSRVETSIIQMRHGAFEWSPIDGLSLQAGAINQEFLNAPFLVGDRAFLSLLSAYMDIRDSYEWQVAFQYSLPSFVNTFNRNNEISETPYFASLFTYGEWIPSEYYSFKGSLTGFYFTPLPAFMIAQSQLYGNSIVGERFRYQYYGAHFDISSQLRLTPSMYVSFGYSGLMNMDAPFDRNWGEQFYTIVDLDYFKWLKIYSRVEYFVNHSD